ncbi:MAG: hypothetical protein HLUCCA05_04405 [Roseibaca calidilacus]|uniref:Uncharacterized protein n=1 Tax=Roseibaca calidilacus TaxID=1666912 RepID=A0A0N8K8Z6_9RHOB|nr:MAG: hypothetical protein HLUCCA05_04405 [Roseibaca calidilacus]CUX81489.1 hypothetical protein Ga0058931_1793 [Roseibaca calidilacus]
MIRANISVAPGPRVGAISPPPWGGGSGAKRVAGDPRLEVGDVLELQGCP